VHEVGVEGHQVLFALGEFFRRHQLLGEGLRHVVLRSLPGVPVPVRRREVLETAVPGHHRVVVVQMVVVFSVLLVFQRLGVRVDFHVLDNSVEFRGFLVVLEAVFMWTSVGVVF